MIHFIHGVFTYISHTNHPFAWLENIPFVPWIPVGFRQSTPFILEGLCGAPKGWWKVREWIPPKCPKLLKMRAPTTRSIQAAVTFLLSRKSLGRSQISPSQQKNRSPAELPFAFEFFEKPLGGLSNGTNQWIASGGKKEFRRRNPAPVERWLSTQ